MEQCRNCFISLLCNGAMAKCIEEGKHLINFHLMKMYYFSMGSIFLLDTGSSFLYTPDHIRRGKNPLSTSLSKVGLRNMFSDLILGVCYGLNVECPPWPHMFEHSVRWCCLEGLTLLR